MGYYKTPVPLPLLKERNAFNYLLDNLDLDLDDMLLDKRLASYMAHCKERLFAYLDFEDEAVLELCRLITKHSFLVGRNRSKTYFPKSTRRTIDKSRA